MRDKVRRQCPQTTTFEEKGEPKSDSNRGPSAYQPNALPLGQTGSLLLVLPRFSFYAGSAPFSTNCECDCFQHGPIYHICIGDCFQHGPIYHICIGPWFSVSFSLGQPHSVFPSCPSVSCIFLCPNSGLTENAWHFSDRVTHATTLRGCANTVGESALKANTGAKLLCSTWDWNLRDERVGLDAESAQLLPLPTPFTTAGSVSIYFWVGVLRWNTAVTVPRTLPPPLCGVPRTLPPSLCGVPRTLPPSLCGVPRTLPPSLCGIPRTLPPSLCGVPRTLPPSLWEYRGHSRHRFVEYRGHSRHRFGEFRGHSRHRFGSTADTPAIALWSTADTPAIAFQRLQSWREDVVKQCSEFGYRGHRK